MKWFSIKGIYGEISKIRWPKRKELVKDSFIALAFMGIFALFFIASDFLITILLRLIGVIS